MGTLCCSEREGKITYSIGASSPVFGKVRLKMDRSIFKEHGIEDTPDSMKIILPRRKVNEDCSNSVDKNKRKRISLLRVDDHTS